MVLQREPSVGFDYDSLDPSTPPDDHAAAYAAAIRLIVLRIFESSRPRLEAGSFLLAADFDIIGIASGRALASSQNVSPEEVSNRVEAWQNLLNLPKNRHNKSPEAVRSYALHNTQRRKLKAT